MVILCTIDLETREVSLPAGQVIASYDHKVDVIRFQVETIPGFSLDTSSIRIAAQGPNNVRHDYAVDPSTVAIEEETGYITFDWPIPQGVTEMPIGTFKYGDRGRLIFAVCAEIIDGSTVSKAWHSDDGIITVVAHLEPESGGGEDPEEEATNAQKIAQLQTNVAVMGTQIGALANGSPTPVATIAEMTDESAVYLYTGSETGYTAGNWYYYNGTAWTSGGVYGGATTSTTFNQHGVPADDFAVGEALAGKADASDLSALETSVTAVEGDVSDLKENLTDLEDRVTALDGGDVDLSYDIVENSYVANTNGKIFNYNGWNRTSYINLKDVSTLKIDIQTSTVYNYFYKSDKSPLENGNLSLTAGVNEITIPENAAFLICSGVAASINAMTVENVREETEANHYAEYETYKEGNLIDYDDVKLGYIDATGAVHNSANTWVTDFCELTGDKVYLYKLTSTRYFAFYDENKVKIATWEDTGRMKPLSGGGTLCYLEVPTGAKYFRGTINNNPETDQTPWVSNYPETPNNYAEYNVSNALPYAINPTNPCDYSELTVRAFSKAVCIGDSLTWGVFNVSNGSSSTGEGQSSAELALRYSYPSNFQRITGIETVNKGDGGETSVSWYAAHSTEDYSQFDLAIIFLGVNDSALSVSDADTLTAMQNIVTMLSNARSDMRIAICSCIPAYERAGYQAKGQLILNWAKGLNNPNIIPLDLAQYSHVKPRTSYVAGHLTALGYYMMALDIARYISWYIDQHKRDFRFIQFIGSPGAEYDYD